ncbi:MAG: DUF2000 family protein [Granulosicoccus sp.]
MVFDTKIVLVIRDDIELWQKLNVTAFLTSGVTGACQNILGAEYMDADNTLYHSLVVQPMIIMSASRETLHRTRQRATNRGVKMAVYIEDMFSTNHDDANRQAVMQYTGDMLPLVGLALRAERKTMDKITKGLKLHD